MATEGAKVGRRGRARERGALLIDAVVAVSFFGTVLGAWAMLTNTKWKVMDEADRRFRAVQACESAIAELRDGARAPGAFQVPGAKQLKGELTVAARPDGWRDVTATVKWREPGAKGTNEQVKLSTVARPGRELR